MLVVLALIALAARVDAAPTDDEIALAVRFADAITGADVAAAHGVARSDRLDSTDDDDDDDDGDSGGGDDDERDEDDDRGERDRDVAVLRERDGLDDEVGRRDADAVVIGDRDDLDDEVGRRDRDAAMIGGGEDALDEELGAMGPAGGGDDGDPASLAVAPRLALEDAGGDDPAGPDTLAMLDAELDPGDAMAGADASVAAATAGAAEVYEQALRHRRPSPWGRLDVGVAWRRRWSEPMLAPAHREDEIWLVATWRR